MIPNLKKMTRIFLTAFFLLLASPLSAEDAPADPFKVKEKIEEVSFSDLFRTHRDEAYIGVILANFIYIDPAYRFIYVKPQEGDLPRMTVYLDKKTSYSTIKVGKLGRGRKQMMLEGDRVALRVFIKSGIVLADEVFLVEGDFGPKARFSKRKYARPAGSGKVGEKSEEKKSGGGH